MDKKCLASSSSSSSTTTTAAAAVSSTVPPAVSYTEMTAIESPAGNCSTFIWL
jgi:hypothetical protein